jgi:hypothetical protein
MPGPVIVVRPNKGLSLEEENELIIKQFVCDFEDQIEWMEMTRIYESVYGRCQPRACLTLPSPRDLELHYMRATALLKVMGPEHKDEKGRTPLTIANMHRDEIMINLIKSFTRGS